MPEYISAQALLSDVRLRLDGLTPDSAVLVVEGWDDKRLFLKRVRYSQQVVVAGGRRLVLSAHSQATPRDRSRVLFMTDCDYEVTLDRMHAAAGLVLTTNVDVESDLVELGALRHVVAELVPEALRTDAVGDVADVIVARAAPIAEFIGRARYVALRDGIGLDTSSLNLSKFRVPGEATVREAKLVQRFASLSPALGTVSSLAEKVCSAPTGYVMCNGHDLVRAVTEVLRTDFKVQHCREKEVARLVRAGLDENSFMRWNVVSRILRWQEETGEGLLR